LVLLWDLLQENKMEKTHQAAVWTSLEVQTYSSIKLSEKTVQNPSNRVVFVQHYQKKT
jgi:hypothetical protein